MFSPFFPLLRAENLLSKTRGGWGSGEGVGEISSGILCASVMCFVCLMLIKNLVQTQKYTLGRCGSSHAVCVACFTTNPGKHFHLLNLEQDL